MSAERHNDTGKTRVCCMSVCLWTRLCALFCPRAFAWLPNAAVPFLSVPSLYPFSQSKTPTTIEGVTLPTVPAFLSVCETCVIKRKMKEQQDHSSVQMRYKSNNKRTVHKAMMSWEKRILDSDPCKNLPDLCSWLGNRLTSTDTEVDVYRRKKGHLPECFMDLPVMKVGDWCVNQSEIVYLYTYKSSYVSVNMLIVINYPKEKIYSFTFCLFFVLSGKYNLFRIPLRRGTWFGSNQYLHSEKSKSLNNPTYTHTYLMQIYTCTPKDWSLVIEHRLQNVSVILTLPHGPERNKWAAEWRYTQHWARCVVLLIFFLPWEMHCQSHLRAKAEYLI